MKTEAWLVSGNLKMTNDLDKIFTDALGMNSSKLPKMCAGKMCFSRWMAICEQKQNRKRQNLTAGEEE